LAVGSLQRTLLCGLFLLISFSIHAQISGKSIPELRREMNAIIPTFQYSKFLTSLSKYKPFHSQPTVPIIYSYHNLALFCKIEVQLEKAVKLPIKFRLGEVEYVDRMEGKY